VHLPLGRTVQLRDAGIAQVIDYNAQWLERSIEATAQFVSSRLPFYRRRHSVSLPPKETSSKE